jgi:probable phosphoglycerate mutase
LIAAPHGIEVDIVDDLTEFGLSMRWRGWRWEQLEERFPGESDAYHRHPWDLPFSPESLDQMAGRVEAVIRRWHLAHPGGELVIVSHQDPVQAARLALTGRPFSSFWDAKPEHAEVITLEAGTSWRELARWGPSIKSGPSPPPAD